MAGRCQRLETKAESLRKSDLRSQNRDTSLKKVSLGLKNPEIEVSQD
jgi:hypothetical protein